MKLEQALELARRFHERQVDKAGRPYLEHILRVVDGVQTEDEKLVAAMHDLVEDTDLTFSDLRCAGAPYRIVQAVDALTKQDNESYEDFIARAAQDPIARSVKLANLADNADESRLALLEREQAGRLRSKYADALRLLQSLNPLSETEYVHAQSDKTGVPVGATEIGVPKDPPEAWATLWCDEDGCGRPSGTMTLIKLKMPDEFGRAGYFVSSTTFLGGTGASVPNERLDAARAAFQSSDARFFYELYWEIAPYWCPRCTWVLLRFSLENRDAVR